MKKYLLTIFVSVIILATPNFISVKAITADELQQQISALLAQIKQLQTQLTEIENQPKEWCYDFKKNLKIEDEGKDVEALQTALAKDGANEWEYKGYDGVFDEKTASAVVGFQEKYADEILKPLGLKYGTGYVGKSTRKVLNRLYGCGATPSPVPSIETGIVISSPHYNEVVSSPLKITGYVNGNGWGGFEGQVGNVELQDNNGNKLSSRVSLEATTDWMKQLVYFKATLKFETPNINEGVLVFYNEDPSGRNLKTFKVPVKFANTSSLSIIVLSPNGGSYKDTDPLTISWTPYTNRGGFDYYLVMLNNKVSGGGVNLKALVSNDNIDKNTTSFVVQNFSQAIKSLTAMTTNGVSKTAEQMKDGYFISVSAYTNGYYGKEVSRAEGSVFTIASTTIGGPVISGVSGPQSLNVNQTGTWTVKASNSNGGNLSYSVIWGDENNLDHTMGSYYYSSPQQSATLTHSYSRAGTYTPTFTVTNEKGQTAQTSLSVKVDGTISSPSIITVISPNGGEVWAKGSTQTIKWNTTGTISTVSISLVPVNNSVSAMTFAANVPNTGSYSWTIPNCTANVPCSSNFEILTGSYYIRVYKSTSTKDIVDESDAPFSVVSLSTTLPIPSITVLSPNGGEVWKGSSGQTIKWISSGIDSVQQISLFAINKTKGSVYEGNSYNLLNTNTTVNDGIEITDPAVTHNPSGYSNVIPVGDYILEIKAKLSNGTTVSDQSDTQFSITQ